METFDLSNYERVYFSGICGVSMSGLAKHLLSLGKKVGGSDKVFGEVSRQLISMGAKVYRGNSDIYLKEFNPQLVVYSSAISKENPEIQYAIKNEVPLVKRSQLLGQIVKGYKKSIAVCGSHGKTTTTLMLAHVLISANKNPTVFAGGYDQEFGNYRKGDNDIVVFEACEYERNFLDVKPTHAIVLNIDNDHMDTYKDLTEVQDAFKLFVRDSVCVINADDNLSSQIEHQTSVTFGIEESATYTAKGIKDFRGGLIFTLYQNGIKRQCLQLNVLGKHNLLNALSVCAMANEMGVRGNYLKNGLLSFKGVSRRMEKIGEFNGKVCFADYAHHPTEIKATVNSLQGIISKNDEGDFLNEQDLFVFQPHTYSRTRFLINEFICVLSKIKNLIVYKSYPARETYDKEGSAKKLFNDLLKVSNGKVLYANTSKKLFEVVEQFPQCKRIFLLGAGDLYDKVKQIINKTK